MDNICPLCNHLMDVHTVKVETIKYEGKKMLVATGWDCPKQSPLVSTDWKD